MYKDITIDYNCLSSLPSEGIPTELHKISYGETDNDNETDPDEGPLDIDKIPFNKKTEQLITDEISNENKLKWPDKNPKPLNGFKIEFLPSMVFPTLFPGGKGDIAKINIATMRIATLAEKVRHLIKFAEFYFSASFTFPAMQHTVFLENKSPTNHKVNKANSQSFMVANLPY